jgi:hypothetical protein
MLRKRTVYIAIGFALAAVIATVAWATPGSAFVTTALVRSTAVERIARSESTRRDWLELDRSITQALTVICVNLAASWAV